MKIKDIEDNNIKQMAVVNTISAKPHWKLQSILKTELNQAFNWKESPQKRNFWVKVYDNKTPNYDVKGLFYRYIGPNKQHSTKRFTNGHIYKSIHKHLDEPENFIDDQGEPNGFMDYNSIHFALAEPEDVYKYLKQAKENKMTQKDTNKDFIDTKINYEIQKNIDYLNDEFNKIKKEQDTKFFLAALSNANSSILINEDAQSKIIYLSVIIDKIAECLNDSTDPKTKINSIAKTLADYDYFAKSNPSLVYPGIKNLNKPQDTIENKEYDHINPNHYKQGVKETWEQMVDIFGLESFVTYCKLNAYKYMSRLGKKPDQPIERDMQKATWYLKKLEELTPHIK